MEQMAKQTDGNDQNRGGGPSAMALEKPEATQAMTDRVVLLDKRTITLDKRTLKMMEMMSLLLEGRNKRDQEPIDHEQDASSLGPASKKADKKSTPKKQSPSFKRAMRHQNP